MTEQHQFYLLTESMITFIGTIVLLFLWFSIQQKFQSKLNQEINIKRIDKGLLFFGLSVLMWSFSAMLRFFFKSDVDINFSNSLVNNLFSILNSSFLILGLYYLDNAPDYLYNNKKTSMKILSALIFLSFLSLVLSVIPSFNSVNASFNFSAIPDIIISFVLAWFLLISLYRTFMNRGMTLIAQLSVFSIILLVISQLPSFFNSNAFLFYEDLIKLISKMMLIAIFLVLGTSWAIELSQTPAPADMKIHFSDWNQLVLTIPPKGIINQKIEFGKKTTQFNNLLKFALRRKYAQEEDMCMEVIMGGEISSQTYLSRIVDNINEILALDQDHKLNRNDLFTFIGQGKYRLRFLQDHIVIDNALMNEFVSNVGNDLYKSYIDE